MASAVNPHPLLAYYVRSGLYRSVVATAEEGLKRRGVDSAVTFWKAVANANEGNMSGAVRDLESIRSRREVEYAVLSALNFFNSSRSDGKLTDALDALERAPEKISPAASVLAAQFQWAIVGDRNIARTMLSRVEKVEGLSPQATESLQTALGWLAVTEGVVLAGSKTVITPSSVPEEASVLSSADQTAQDMDAASRAMAFFEAATAAGASKTLPIDAMMGIAAAYERRGDYVRAVDTYTDILNTYNWFVPAACEQARLFCKAGDWDNANDAIARVLEVDATNVECLRLLAHEALLREGSSLRAVARLQDLLNAIAKAEPRNAKLYYDVSRVCARLGNRSPAVLSVTLSMLDSASRCEPDNAIYQCETGAQRSLMGDFAGAAAAYREAGRLDESNPDAVPGMISVQIAQGLLEDAESQLEMYRLIAESVTSSRTPQLALLEAQLAWKKGRNRAQSLKMLSDAILVWATRLGISGDSINAKGKVVSSSRFRVVPGATPGLAGGDGLPLPMLLPGPASSFYEWYYAACVDPIMYDIARDLLLQQESSSSAAGSLAALLSSIAHVDALTRMAEPGSAHAAITTIAAVAAAGTGGASSNPVVSAPGTVGATMLFTITAVQPAHMPSWLLLASMHAAAQNWDSAVASINRALQLNPSYSDGHLLLAHVGLAKGDTRLASSALEAALAQSFAVQESASYLRMKAAVLAAQGKHEDAINVCDSAMRIPGVRYAGTGKVRGASSASSVSPPLSLHERASLYLLLAECHLNMDHVPEATKVVTDAMSEFTGTSEEARVTVSSSRLALKKGDADLALSLLTSIPASSPAYPQAVALKATIYLTHRRDRRLFIQCYVDVATRHRTEANLIALAEAYMKVQMPEEAIAAYEQALSLRPSNTALACKIGRALSLMHDYKRAVTYYTSALAASDGTTDESEGALTSADKAALRSDLTELLVKLRRFDEANALIQQALADSKVAGDGANADIVALRYARKNLQLLSRVLKGTGDINAAGEVLDQAISVQQRVISIARRDPAAASLGVSMAGAYARLAAASSNVSAVDVDRLEAADLHLALGNFCEREAVPPQDERAKRCYVEASHFSEGIMDSAAPATSPTATAKGDGAGATFALPTTYERSLLALARLHLRRAEIDECRNVCSTITKSNPGNEEASVMLADLLFRQNDTAAATYHFSTLLERRPNAYEALARLITLLRRAGRLSDAQKFLRQAIRAVPSAEVNDAGYRFCKALYCWYNNEPHEAIKLFNSTRLTGTWGVKATEYMVQIYLSPDNDPLWVERDADSSASPEAIGEALRVASKLLEDIPKQDRTLLHDVLNAYILIAARTKVSVEEAVNRLSSMLESDADYAPALQALATAYMVQKQSPKARNLVKRLQKLPFDTELTDHWVQAHLLMSDIQIESGKYDQAVDALNAVLALDSSCARAYEYLGAIAEREVRYAEAAELYERAWKYENESSAPVGFKLAFNYLKAGRYVSAIDVCHKILKQFPDYPKIKSDVLDKARALLRT